MCQACDKALANRVGNRQEYDLSGAGLLLQCYDCRSPITDEYVGRQFDQLTCERFDAADITGCPAVIYPKIAAIDPPQLCEPFPKRRHQALSFQVRLRQIY